MRAYPLKIVTPDGIQFDGMAEELVARTTGGDVAILAGHINYVSPLGMGQATVRTDGGKRYAACMGGMVSVVDGKVTLVPTTFEWADKIDVARAEASQHKAETVLSQTGVGDTDIRLAEARLKRALIRKSVASHKHK